MAPTAILDVDGTLVDTNYQHALAWYRAFRRQAAGRAGIPTIGVLTGGFSHHELRDAGAAVVFESIAELRGRLAETPLSAAQRDRETLA